MKIEALAKIVHEANRAYCESTGDTSQLPWNAAEQWQREAAVTGIKDLAKNPELSPADMHNKWREAKHRNGWVYGPVKDGVLKTHPCMVDYDLLSEEQQAKDHLFHAIVTTFADVLEWDEYYGNDIRANGGVKIELQ